MSGAKCARRAVRPCGAERRVAGVEQEDRDKAAAVRAGDELWRNLFGEEPPGAEDAARSLAVSVRGHAEGEEMGETFDGDGEEMQLDGEAWEDGEEPGRIGDRQGGAIMRRLGDPRLPSKKEVDEHNLTHLPYRNWCPHCVRGRGKDLDHRRAVDDERRVREFSFDYCFPGDDRGKRITVLVGRERMTGMTMAAVVPVKGSSGQYAVKRVMEFIHECGADEAEIIVKTDQEPSIEALVADIVKTRGRKITHVERSPVGSSGSNGVAERAVQSVEGVMRTLVSALQERLGVRIGADERIVTFVAEYAAYLLNRKEVGKDGKTAYERSKGKKATILAIEFGEKLLYKLKPKEKMEKLNPRWDYGVFVGVRADSGEIWVATKEGVKAVRSVRRIASERRWCQDNKDWVTRVPWNKEAEDPEADGEIPEGPRGEDGHGGGASSASTGPRIVVINTREVAPKEFFIQRKDLEQHGQTKGCAGCRTMIDGGNRQAHSSECRERFRRLMQGDEKVQRTQERRDEYEERIAETELRRQEMKMRRAEGEVGRGGPKMMI